MPDLGLTPAEFAAALAQGEVVEPGSPITSTYRAQLARLIIELARARLSSAYTAAAQLEHAPSMSTKSSLAQQVTDRVRQSHELFRLLEPLGVDIPEHVRAVDARPQPSPRSLAAAFSNSSLSGAARDGSWFPGPDSFIITTYHDFVGYNAVVGCAQEALVSELHMSSWGPLRRVARAISREELPHRTASIRLLVDPDAALASGAPSLTDSELSQAQQRLDTWFGAMMTWFASCDPAFAAVSVDLRLRTRDSVRARMYFEQQLRNLATTAELAVPAFITTQ